MRCSLLSLFSLFRPYNRFLKVGSCQEGVKIPWKIGQKGARSGVTRTSDLRITNQPAKRLNLLINIQVQTPVSAPSLMINSSAI